MRRAATLPLGRGSPGRSKATSLYVVYINLSVIHIPSLALQTVPDSIRGYPGFVIQSWVTLSVSVLPD